MYGMIHKAIRDMVVTKFGEDTWEIVAKDANVGDEHLLSMSTYDDKVMYAMVESACKVLELSQEQVYESFGRYFVEVTLQTNFKSLLHTYGGSSFALFENLNTLHETISTTYTGYSPPFFEVTRRTDNEIDLFYQSERGGLSPFVRGMVFGLADFYEEVVLITEEEEITTMDGERIRFRLVRE